MVEAVSRAAAIPHRRPPLPQQLLRLPLVGLPPLVLPALRLGRQSRTPQACRQPQQPGPGARVRLTARMSPDPVARPVLNLMALRANRIPEPGPTLVRKPGAEQVPEALSPPNPAPGVRR